MPRIYGAIKPPLTTPQLKDIRVTIKPTCILLIAKDARINTPLKTLIIRSDCFSLTCLFKYPLYKSIVIALEETKIIEARVDIDALRINSIIIARSQSGRYCVIIVGIIMA